MSTMRANHGLRPRYSVTAMRPSFAYSPAPNRLGPDSSPVTRFRLPGTERLRRGVAHLVAQHLEQPPAIEIGIGELRGQDQIRIEIGARVVRVVDAHRRDPRGDRAAAASSDPPPSARRAARAATRDRPLELHAVPPCRRRAVVTVRRLAPAAITDRARPRQIRGIPRQLRFPAFAHACSLPVPTFPVTPASGSVTVTGTGPKTAENRGWGSCAVAETVTLETLMATDFLKDRGNPWDHDPGPRPDSRIARLFAETPNYRAPRPRARRPRDVPLALRSDVLSRPARRQRRQGAGHRPGGRAGRVARPPILRRRHRRAHAALPARARHHRVVPVPEHVRLSDLRPVRGATSCSRSRSAPSRRSSTHRHAILDDVRGAQRSAAGDRGGPRGEGKRAHLGAIARRSVSRRRARRQRAATPARSGRACASSAWCTRAAPGRADRWPRSSPTSSARSAQIGDVERAGSDLAAGRSRRRPHRSGRLPLSQRADSVSRSPVRHVVARRTGRHVEQPQGQPARHPDVLGGRRLRRRPCRTPPMRRAVAKGTTTRRGDLPYEPPKHTFGEFDRGSGRGDGAADDGRRADLAWPDFAALGVTSHVSFGHGPIYRGRLADARLLVLADQESHDDLFTGRAMTGDAGQRFQAFLRAAGFTRRYAILRALPVDTLDLPRTRGRDHRRRPAGARRCSRPSWRASRRRDSIGAAILVGPLAQRLAPHVLPGRRCRR